MDLLPVEPCPRGGRMPSSQSLNEYISGMGYPIHFYETEISFVGTWECARSYCIDHILKYFLFFVKSFRNSIKRLSSVEISTPL